MAIWSQLVLRPPLEQVDLVPQGEEGTIGWVGVEDTGERRGRLRAHEFGADDHLRVMRRWLWSPALSPWLRRRGLVSHDRPSP